MPNVKDLLAAAERGSLSPADVPPVASELEKAAYSEMARKIYAETEGRFAVPEERAHSPQGRLASALWQRVSEWEDRSSEEE